MRLIVGLGNPGARYAFTRHNAGFWVLDELAKAEKTEQWQKKSDVLVTDIGRVVLLKPQSFMNLSGGAVYEFARYKNITASEMLVVLDDLDIALGRIKIRPGGTSGGHKGMDSIIRRFGTNQIARIKIGIGRPEEGVDPAEYVLMRPDDPDRAQLDNAVSEAVGACRYVIAHGVEAAMNRFNGPEQT